MRRRSVVAGAVMFFMAVLSTAALGHASRTSSDPEAGATLQEVPEHLYINFAEPPTSDFRLTVLDGCDRDVVEFAEAKNQTIHAILKEGQPGKWTVESSVISGLDGHATDDTFSFSVEGTKDCSAPEPEETPVRAAPEESSGGKFPWLLLGGGAVLLIGGAALLRLRS